MQGRPVEACPQYFQEGAGSMQAVAPGLGALAVAVIYYTYRDLLLVRLRQSGGLRARVAYMLWAAAEVA